jgi:SAM-dependent methyltransferase
MSQQNELSKLYQIRFNEHDILQKNLVWKIICVNFFQKWLRTTDTVVDVACGHGEFINNITCAKRMAIDFNPDARKYLDVGIEFHLGDANNIVNLVGQDIADVLFTSNFLEHLPDKKNLNLFLEQVYTVLKPGGRYLIMGPNLRYLASQYWDFYDHHLGLTHLSLCEVLRLKGFEIKTCIAKFLPYTTQSRLPKHPFFVWLYLKAPLIWQLLGKQFFIVATKASKNL